MILLTVELVDVVVLEMLRLLTVNIIERWGQVGRRVPHQLRHELLGEVLGIGGRSSLVRMEDLVPVSSRLKSPGPPAYQRSLTTTRRLQNLVESTASVERLGDKVEMYIF